MQPLDRADLWVAGGVAGAAALAFASTFSSRAALGDAPETVAGVRSLGILHAPGYVTYVAAARAFGEVVRVGSWELRVNLFSLVCASLSIAVVYLLARCFGANRTGGAIGALALAVALSFWFNAGFAKYYAFSTLLLTSVALCVLVWQQRGGNWLLVVAGVLAGSTIGVSWQLASIMVAGLAFLVWRDRRRIGVGLLVLVGAAAIVTAIGVCVYILVRAGQDPAVNYGNATSISRLFDLLTTADFQGTRSTAGAGFGSVAGNSMAYLAIIGRDIGLGVVALALAGAVDVYDRRRLDHALFFAVVGFGNVVAVGFVAGKTEIYGFFSGLVSGGQLTNALVVLAVLAALGATFLLHELEEWRADQDPRRWRIAAAGAMVLATIVPSLVVHFANADHRIPPLGDRYARRVLAALPPNSVFLAGGYEFGQPIISRQLLYGDRPDVTVVSADTIAFPWYRDEMVDRLDLDPALVQATSENAVTRFVTALRKTRPVYADPYAMLYGAQLFGYRAEGLVGRVVEGTGPQAGSKFEAAAAALQRDEAQDGMTGRKYIRFPNNALYFFYERAHVELAKQYALADDLDRAADEIERALVFGPENQDRSAITAVREHRADAKQIVLGL